MGNNSSKRYTNLNVDATNDLSVNKHGIRRESTNQRAMSGFWSILYSRPGKRKSVTLSAREWRHQEAYDLSSSSPDIPTRVTSSTSIFSDVPPTASSTRSIALHFIKSKISKIFNFRKTPTTATSATKIFDVNGNPLTRRKISNNQKVGSDNVFSRPIFPEIVNIYDTTVTTVFPLTVEDEPNPKSSHLSHTPSNGNTELNRTTPNLSDTPSNGNTEVNTPKDAMHSSGSSGDSLQKSSDSSTDSTSSSSTPPPSGSVSAQVSNNPDPQTVSPTANPPQTVPSTANPPQTVPSTANPPQTVPSITTNPNPKPPSKTAPKSKSNPTLSKNTSSPIKATAKGGGGGGGKKGCCHPVAPPVYLDYGSYCGGGGSGGGRGNTSSSGNAILNRLKNVDVIEELQYHVPGQDCGDNTSDSEFDYYYQCNECGEMEFCKDGGGAGGNKNGKPVVYSRRQRFNFGNGNNNNQGEDGPPFSWPYSCNCLCCRAGLRRNPNCQCKCCSLKGVDRVSNSFDEIPVGKNPEPKPCICGIDDNDKEQEEPKEVADPCEDLLPKNSGVYFYDADQKKFVRQELRTPTPIIIEDDVESNPYSCGDDDDEEGEDESVVDLTEVIRCIPTMANKTKNIAPPEPVILPAIYGGCCDMNAIVQNLEAVITGKDLALAPKPKIESSGKTNTTTNTGTIPSENNTNAIYAGSATGTRQSTHLTRNRADENVINLMNQAQENINNENEDEDNGDGDSLPKTSSSSSEKTASLD